MGSIIFELQKEVSSPNCDIVSILRRAHLIASKLHLKEFDSWIMCELNGYPDQKSIPDYRIVRGAIKAHNPYAGWNPVMILDPEIEKRLCEHKMPNSISEIIDLCEKSKNGIIMQYSGEIQEFLNNCCDSLVPLQNALHISTSAVIAIIEKVKNTVLEWTIRLEEEGVVGDNMTFSSDECNRAQNVPQTVNYYFGNTNVIAAPAESLQVVAGDNNHVRFSHRKVTKATEEIEKSIRKADELTKEDKETALEMIADIKGKISQKKKPNIIKFALTGLYDFLIQVGASLTAGLVQAKIHGLF